MTQPTISFVFEDTRYFVSMDAYDTNYILLPDGRTLQAQGWFESFPPQVGGLVVVDSFEGATPAQYESTTL